MYLTEKLGLAGGFQRGVPRVGLDWIQGLGARWKIWGDFVFP